MKKFLSMLLALSLLLSLSAVAFAATTENQLADGNNTIELPWDTDEASVYTYTATQTGTLYIAAVEFYSNDRGKGYSDNSDMMNEWGMYTEFTVDGQSLEGIHYGSVNVVEGQTYTISWAHGADVVNQSWYKLGWKAVINLSYTGEAVPQPGSEELPVELNREQCPVDSIEVPAGESVYYLLQGFAGAEFLVYGVDAQVLPRALNPETGTMYAEPFKSVDGVVTVPVENDYLLVCIDNVGQENAVFKLDCFVPCGTANNPEQLKPGSYVVTTEKGDETGYFFSFTAQCNGTLILTFPESGWMGAWENVTAGTGKQWFDYGGSNPLVIEVHQGDVLLINITAFKFNIMGNATFGGEVSFTAAVEYAHEFVDGVCTHCGQAEVQATLGDVNGDGKLNARDARALLRYIAGLTDDTEIDENVADYNKDGKVNARDARAMLRHIAGLD